MNLPDLPAALPRRLAAGEALFHAGDPPLGLVVVRAGLLELRRVSPEGRASVLHRAGPGESFAEASLFEARHHCDGIAAQDSLVDIHPATAIRRAMATSPALAMALAAHLASRLVEAPARAERLTLPRAEDRLLDALDSLAAGPDGLRRLPRSWKALAGELGLTHEATYRALARMEREGRLARPGPALVRLAV